MKPEGHHAEEETFFMGLSTPRHSDVTLEVRNVAESPPTGLSMMEHAHDESVDNLSHIPAAPSPETSFSSPPRRQVILQYRSFQRQSTPQHANNVFDSEDDILLTQHPNMVRNGNTAFYPQTPKERFYQKRPHETVHAQSLLLGIAFLCVWSPNNLMAPHLTDMAESFGFASAQERDLYLGSYCALATGVMSLPIAAGIGILADLVSRQRLFVCCVAGGGLSALLTSFCNSYKLLFVCRLLNGGFMSGSVPVTFSFLGDLFHVQERNAASSGLTAMMGAGIIAGQVYAGMVVDWRQPFVVSGASTLAAAALCACLVQEPERGAKEKVLQEMIAAGTRYERKLTLDTFWHAMRHNASNRILLWQGFFSSLPWGIVFVFLNDFLSQEVGLSVPDATYLVLVFGVGCATGGILGGYAGQQVQRLSRSLLPLFMATTTLLGIVPFLWLLNSTIESAHTFKAISLSFAAGLVASLPSVNVRPCLINVNPPETRGASLTAANLLIALGRGVGPSCVTLMGSIGGFERRFSFNVTLAGFWIISSFQLLLLAKTLPQDQDAMESELASYAQAQIKRVQSDPNTSVISIEDRITTFDGTAAIETIDYMRQGLQELRVRPFRCGSTEELSSDEESELQRKRDKWRERTRPPSERTPLVA